MGTVAAIYGGIQVGLDGNCKFPALRQRRFDSYCPHHIFLYSFYKELSYVTTRTLDPRDLILYFVVLSSSCVPYRLAVDCCTACLDVHGNAFVSFSHIARKCSTLMGSPAAFILALVLILVWALSGPLFHFNETWQLVANTFTTLITFVSVFLIQNAQNHDTRAINAKLDDLILHLDDPDNRFVAIEAQGEHVLDELSRELQEKVDGQTQN